MIIIGVDFHPEFQQIAFVDSESGEFHSLAYCRGHFSTDWSGFYPPSTGITIAVGWVDIESSFVTSCEFQFERLGLARLRIPRMWVVGEGGCRRQLMVACWNVETYSLA